MSALQHNLKTSVAIHRHVAPILHTLPVPYFYRAGFADKANQDVVNILVAEVKTHLPDVPSVTIKGKFPFGNGVNCPYTIAYTV